MCKGSSPYVSGCVINDNETGITDAAVKCTYQSTGPSSGISSQPTIEQCSISYNTPGAGMYITKSSPVVRNTKIIGNYRWGIGGQDFDFPPPDLPFNPLFENCLIAGNWDSEVDFSAGSLGGGAINATFKNCTITSTYGGPGIKLYTENPASIVRLENCIVSHNSLL